MDTSLGLGLQFSKLGQKVYYTTPAEIWKNSNTLQTRARLLVSADESNVEFSQPEILDVSRFKHAHMRSEPPVDTTFLNITWLMEQFNVSLINSPSSLRKYNEKLIILEFPNYIDPVYVGNDLESAAKFVQQECDNDAVIKPLDLYGGKDVLRVDHTFFKNAELDAPHIIQPFNPAIADGEIRVFTAFKQIIHWCLKKPTPGEFLANTSAGATLHSYTPTPKIEKMVQDVVDHLDSKGVSITGMDIIGDKISEINITSPRLLAPSYEERQSYLAKVAQAYASYYE